MSKPNSDFYIGLCLAGAVSAGAYTAGVIDYLNEALEEWQKRKDSNSPNTPSHNVIIPVIGGASAGGMTGIILSSAINYSLTSITHPSNNILDEQPHNKLYHTWVDLLGQDMFFRMLETEDIKREGLVSICNSGFIEEIANRSLSVDAKQWKPSPPYYDRDLKIFTTLTNVQGFTYNISFTSNSKSDKYFMTIHNDYACFILNNYTNSEKGWMTLDFQNNINISIAKDAAMATGAFPLGLRARAVSRESNVVNHLPWCNDITTDYPVEPPTYNSLFVDGGLINNEPFEKVRELLIAKTGQDSSDEYQDYDKFTSTILMVDPFPSEKPGKFEIDFSIINIIEKTFTSILQQMRTKPRTLHKAMDSAKAGQFLITPTRRRPTLNNNDENIAGERAIACGALGGFSGFISKEFRIHDYFLGRFNCELFLRDYFTIPLKSLSINKIFKEGYEGLPLNKFQAKDGSIPIIPIFTERLPDRTLPLPTFTCGINWPRIEEAKIDVFYPLIQKRVQEIVMNLFSLNKLKTFLLWIGLKGILNNIISNAILRRIKRSLLEHELLVKNK